MTMQTRILTEEGIRNMTEGEITSINSSGTEIEVPEGMTAWEMVEMLEVPGNVQYELNGTQLTISMQNVGTKGL